MFKSGYLLDTTEKLKAAQFNRSYVEVWQHGFIANYGGPIEYVSEISVKINDSYYLRENSEFRIR